MADNNFFNHEFTGNQPLILSKRLMFESMLNQFWGQFVKFTTKNMVPAMKNQKVSPVDSPIVMHNELERKQGDTVEVPLMRQFSGRPKIGNQQLAGHEGEQHVNFKRVYIDVVRNAIRPIEGPMSEQTNKDYSLLSNSYGQLRDNYSRVENYSGVSWAFYNGFSENVMFSDILANDANIKQVSHPHIYYIGGSKVSYSSGYPSTSGYEGAVRTAIGTVGSSDIIDINALNALGNYAAIRKIPPLIRMKGMTLWGLAMHPWQITALLNSTDGGIKNTYDSVMIQSLAKDHPWLNNAVLIWGNFAIFNAGDSVFSCEVSGSNLYWGPQSSTTTGYSDLDDFDAPPSGRTVFGAIVFGSNAIMGARGSRLKFLRNSEDYGALQGIAYQSLEGFSRSDYYNKDDGTAGQYMINESSAIVLSYAAQPTV